MNKKTLRIAGWALGLSMAVAGIGFLASEGERTIQAKAGTATNYQLISGAIEEGDYIVYYSGKAMKAEVSSNRLSYRDVTAKNNIISTEYTDIIWHISSTEINEITYYTFVNGSSYASATKSNNQAALLTEATDYSYWKLDSNTTYDFINKGNSRYLRNNGTYGFAAYASGTGGALSLYRKVEVSSDKIDDSSNPFTVTATPTVEREGALPNVNEWTVTAKLVGKDPVTITSGLSIKGTPSTSVAGTIDVTLVYTAANGQYALNSGDATYDIATSMTVTPKTATVEFKEDNYVLAPGGTLTLGNEISQSGDGNLTYEIVSGNSYVSISDGVLTANALGTATIKVTKGAEIGDSFKVSDTATVEVSNVVRWSHSFSGDFDDGTARQTKTLSNKTWNVELIDSTYFGTSNGLQMGKGADPASKVTLSSSDFAAYSEIKEIKIQTWGASSISGSLSVKVGDTNYKSNSQTSVSIPTSDTTFTFVGDTADCGDIVITWTQPSTSKAIYLKSLSVTYDATPIEQAGIKASWRSQKGTYFNGSVNATSTVSTRDLVVNTTNAKGQIYGDANITGAGFMVYVKNGENKWVKADKSVSDSETPFLDASSSFKVQSLSDFGAGTYSLYVTTPKDGGGVWTSETIDMTITAKAPSSITPSAELSDQEYIAGKDAFAPFEGTISVSYNDTDTANSIAPTIKYYVGESEVDIEDYLDDSNRFDVNSNTTIEARLYDPNFVGEYEHLSYSIYAYASSLTVEDGNGEDAEYESGGTVTLNPSAALTYTDKNSADQTVDLTASDLDLYIKLKDAEGDGELYSGTLPEVEEETLYTITAVYKNDTSKKATYDIAVVNAVFSINTNNVQKQFSFGSAFNATGLVVNLKYGSADPIVIGSENYTIEDENGDPIDVIKFLGEKTVTVRYKGYSASYVITGTNTGSSDSNVHDSIPAQYTLGNSTNYSVGKANVSAGSLGGSDRLAKGSTLTVTNAFGEGVIVGSINVTFQVKSSSSSNAGATFTMKMTALSGSKETAYEVTGVQKTLTSSYSDISFSINNIPASASIDGWKITVTNKVNGSGSGQNGNADWDNFSGTYTPYNLSDPVVYNATPLEQVKTYSEYFLGVTDATCVSFADKWSTLKAEFEGMVDESKALFSASNDLTVSAAYERYVYLTTKATMKESFPAFEGVVANGSNDIASASVSYGNNNLILAIVAAAGMTAAGGIFLLARKRRNED